MTYQETIDAFRAAMASAGVITNDPIIADGQLHRFHAEGDRAGSRNGAYILHSDGHPAGYYEHFKSGVKSTWSLSGQRPKLTKANWQQIEANREQRQEEQAATHAKAAEKATKIWQRAIVFDNNNPYCQRKRIQPFGAKTGDSGGLREVLIVAVRDATGALVNLQFIQPDGTKRFLSGGRKKGCFAIIGDLSNVTHLLLCEGYATGCSLHQSLAFPVLVALDAGNLVHVARSALDLFPDAEIVVMGDNDLSGVGQKAARQAALACRGKYLVPSTPGHDWNDSINAAEGV